jgi:hypothetical protein
MRKGCVGNERQHWHSTPTKVKGKPFPVEVLAVGAFTPLAFFLAIFISGVFCFARLNTYPRSPAITVGGASPILKGHPITRPLPVSYPAT